MIDWQNPDSIWNAHPSNHRLVPGGSEYGRYLWVKAQIPPRARVLATLQAPIEARMSGVGQLMKEDLRVVGTEPDADSFHVAGPQAIRGEGQVPVFDASSLCHMGQWGEFPRGVVHLRQFPPFRLVVAKDGDRLEAPEDRHLFPGVRVCDGHQHGGKDESSLAAPLDTTSYLLPLPIPPSV